MTDPWRELHTFKASAALQAQPLATDEVRRLAERRRRRQVIGAAAAVALVLGGTGVSLAGSGVLDNRLSDPLPPAITPGPTTAGQTATTPYGSDRYLRIPADYPWLSFIDDPGGDGSVDGPGATVPLPTLRPCGRLTWNPTELLTQRAVRSNIPESTEIRQVLLFPDQGAAQVALDDVRETFSRCPIQRYPDGFATNHDVFRRLGAAPAPPASAGDAFLAVSARSTFHDAPAIGRTEMRWVRIDNAVVYTWDTSEAMSDSTHPGHEADQQVRRMVAAWCELAGHC